MTSTKQFIAAAHPNHLNGVNKPFVAATYPHHLNDINKTSCSSHIPEKKVEICTTAYKGTRN